jgi:hypothetical protein
VEHRGRPERDPIWHRWAAAYLVAQGVLGVGWWVLLATSPTVRSWFELLPHRTSALDSFLLADLTVFIGGSIASGWLLWRVSRWAVLATACTAGGLAYATLCLVAWVVFESSPRAGIAPMVVATVLTGWIAVRLRSDETA